MLRTERRGGVEILTIDRQQAGNSISSDLTTALLETLERLAGDAKLHSVVITGGGLKTIEAVADKVSDPLRIPARLEKFDAALAARDVAPVAVGV